VRYDAPMLAGSRPSSPLEGRLEFETLIADTSARLMTAPPEQIDGAIESALGRVREFFQADRCALLAVSADQRVVNVRLGSYADGVPDVPTHVNLAEAFPWLRRKLLVERVPVRVSTLADLPPEADIERPSWEQMGVRSSLVLPIETGAEVRHLVVVHTVHVERQWPDVLTTRLRLLGELLVGALERKEMILGLREAEARVSLAADSAEAGLWILDCSTGVYWATERTRAIFGYAPGEVITSERFLASVHPLDRRLVGATLERALRDPRPTAVDYRILKEDGRLRWVSSRGRPYFKPTGEPEHLTGISVDVTERRSTDEALRRSEARLATGADLAGLAFYEVDFEVRAAYVDDRFRETCGVPPDRQLGLQALDFWLERLHPDDRSRVLDIRRRFHDGSVDEASLEYRFQHPVRGQRWFHHLARVARRDAAGKALVTYGVLRDITDRKRADEELADLSRRLIRAQEEERAMLARELHDDVTQRLAVLAIDAGRAELAASSGEQAEAMRALREGLVLVSEDVHSLAYQLHSSVLEELGLVEALRAACERVGRRSPIKVSLDLDSSADRLGKDSALCLFRVAQEALNNVARHARGQVASVALQPMDGGVLLAVRDDGVGFDPASPGTRKTLGLASMRERLRLVNGTLDIESTPGHGTAIVAWVPAQEGSP
jgi:PAS domain S-box-containing protein